MRPIAFFCRRSERRPWILVGVHLLKVSWNEKAFNWKQAWGPGPEWNTVDAIFQGNPKVLIGDFIKIEPAEGGAAAYADRVLRVRDENQDGLQGLR